MRKSGTSLFKGERIGTNFLFHEGKLIGINFPADFVSEHEWGIKDLKTRFGIKSYKPQDGPIGLERFKATACPIFSYKEINGRHVLICSSYHRGDDYIPHDLRGNSDLVGAWDEKSFGINAKEKNHLDILCEAIRNCNIAITLRDGLSIYIADAIPKSIIDKWVEQDSDKKKLYEEFESSGIEKKLADAGKKYFALMPRWKDDKKPSKYKICFWLNPNDQHLNNFGWYTVEELEQWIKEEGPIPKKEVQSSKR